ncbi:MAG TPA: hypothetical protein VL856_03285, partial [Acidimicrobiia bacterium]|nr:hypothetical protein [Acidimicrobiia bacterium]
MGTRAFVETRWQPYALRLGGGLAVNVSRPAGSLSKPRNRRVAAVDSIDVTVGILVTVIGGVILATILGVSKLTRDR